LKAGDHSAFEELEDQARRPAWSGLPASLLEAGMASANLEIHGASIVFAGRLNPAIFHPEWFRARGLLSDVDADAGVDQLSLVHPDLTSFRANWIEVEVQGNRIKFATATPSRLNMLGDFVSNVFNFLEHTPITAVGLNRELHYNVGSSDAWHAAGHHFLPKAPFERHLGGKVGMKSLRVWGNRPGTDARVQLDIQPSARVDPGVYFAFNEHYDLEGRSTAVDACAIVTKHWDDSLVYTQDAADAMMAEVPEPGE
jgi:hypothetical protein